MRDASAIKKKFKERLYLADQGDEPPPHPMKCISHNEKYTKLQTLNVQIILDLESANLCFMFGIGFTQEF